MPTPASHADGPLEPQKAVGHGPQAVGVRQYERHGVCVIAPHGAYDMDSVGPLADALHSAAVTYRKVVLDASEVTFADSSFLNLLIAAHRSVALRVAAPSPRVERLLEITGVDGLLEIRGTVDEAAVS
ncbi:STAS domain-containing protein [Streptomyces sp. NPDC053367]|uniref:STAS domain-containing protein n=1 Tax=Streptomyces sp. NPDC053367 TaxID=3365700 RepID=UPI0037D8FB37